MKTLTHEQTLEALRGGDLLFITLPNPEKKSDRIAFGLVRRGAPVGKRVYDKIKDDLLPIQDGLFGDETSQSFRLKDGA